MYPVAVIKYAVDANFVFQQHYRQAHGAHDTVQSLQRKTLIFISSKLWPLWLIAETEFWWLHFQIYGVILQC